MKAAAGFLGVVLAMGAGLYLYNAQLTSAGGGAAAAPQEQIDVTGIRMALLEIAQAQRTYVTAHGAYGDKQGWPTLTIDASMQVAER